jgi:hypothetical protein
MGAVACHHTGFGTSVSPRAAALVAQILVLGA